MEVLFLGLGGAFILILSVVSVTYIPNSEFPHGPHPHYLLFVFLTLALRPGLR